MIRTITCLGLMLLNISVIAQNRPTGERYSIVQATSERAQLHTVAFSGLAFMTGNFGADTFFPPGKVADFFGFQYMRDNDQSEKGHHTDFLTRIANNVIAILSVEQLNELKVLANKQAAVYDSFAMKRMVLIKAFRTAMETDKSLNKVQIKLFGEELYTLDAELSYGRAVTLGHIIRSFSDGQKVELAKLAFDHSETWPDLPENLDKRQLSHRAHVAVMTYASELYSWYAGSLKADVYFCPERHGTYFGGFYLKDFPAMGNPDYGISTSLTGDAGRDFIRVLTTAQNATLSACMRQIQPILGEIVHLRGSICMELRKAMNGEYPNKTNLLAWIKQYGGLDAELSYYEITAFSSIYHSLSDQQKSKLLQIRNQSDLPKGYYLYSDPIESITDVSINQFFE